jgi:Protein of unknown function (DUF3311)
MQGGSLPQFPVEDKCIMLCNMPPAAGTNTKTTHRRSKWILLLVLPYLGLCFPQMYARATPALWGFPFFYWYQLAWVIATSALLGVVYYKLKT